jgi:hypothetical protein
LLLLKGSGRNHIENLSRPKPCMVTTGNIFSPLYESELGVLLLPGNSWFPRITQVPVPKYHNDALPIQYGSAIMNNNNDVVVLAMQYGCNM